MGSTVDFGSFEQFGALYMHNHDHDDKYPARPGFESGTFRLQDPVDTNEPSGPVVADDGPVLKQHWYNVSCLCSLNLFHRQLY